MIQSKISFVLSAKCKDRKSADIPGFSTYLHSGPPSAGLFLQIISQYRPFLAHMSEMCPVVAGFRMLISSAIFDWSVWWACFSVHKRPPTTCLPRSNWAKADETQITTITTIIFSIWTIFIFVPFDSSPSAQLSHVNSNARADRLWFQSDPQID